MAMSAVIIKREWADAQISITVTSTGIGISIPMDEFMVACGIEMGNPLLLMTNAQLVAKLKAAAERVIDGAKDETKRVM